MPLPFFLHKPEMTYDEGWDRFALRYQELPKDNSIYRLTKAMGHHLVTREMGTNGQGRQLLDVNCGTGNDFDHFLAQGWKITGTDGSAGMLNKAFEKYEDAVNDKRLALHQLLLEDLKADDFAPQSFDLIFSVTGGFSYIDDNELLRVNSVLKKFLKPNGKLIVANLNAFCLTESAYFLLKGNLKAATRRKKGSIKVDIRGQELTMYLRTKQQLESLYAQSFNVEGSWPLLAATPPYQSGYNPGNGRLKWHERIERALLNQSIASTWCDQVVTVCAPL